VEARIETPSSRSPWCSSVPTLADLEPDLAAARATCGLATSIAVWAAFAVDLWSASRSPNIDAASCRAAWST